MVLYKGSSSIQRSNYEVILDKADEFVMKEDEDPRDLYRRVTAIAVALKDHGSKDVDDTWVKRKFSKPSCLSTKPCHLSFISGQTFTPCLPVRCWMNLLQCQS